MSLSNLDMRTELGVESFLRVLRGSHDGGGVGILGAQVGEHILRLALVIPHPIEIVRPDLWRVHWIVSLVLAVNLAKLDLVRHPLGHGSFDRLEMAGTEPVRSATADAYMYGPLTRTSNC